MVSPRAAGSVQRSAEEPEDRSACQRRERAGQFESAIDPVSESPDHNPRDRDQRKWRHPLDDSGSRQVGKADDTPILELMNELARRTLMSESGHHADAFADDPFGRRPQLTPACGTENRQCGVVTGEAEHMYYVSRASCEWKGVPGQGGLPLTRDAPSRTRLWISPPRPHGATPPMNGGEILRLLGAFLPASQVLDLLRRERLQCPAQRCQFDAGDLVVDFGGKGVDPRLQGVAVGDQVLRGQRLVGE